MKVRLFKLFKMKKQGILFLNKENSQWTVKEKIGKYEVLHLLYFEAESDIFLSLLRDNSEVVFILVDEFSNPELFKNTPFMEGNYKAKLIF
jgi:hypothetical protein